jgi:hypothetical protein
VVDCRFSPMARGATLAAFRIAEAKPEQVLPKIAAQL